MNRTHSNARNFWSVKSRVSIFVGITALLTSTLFCYAQGNKEKTNDSTLLDSFIQAKGYSGVIQFFPSNIKQFWVDNSVMSQNDLVTVILNKRKDTNMESVPFPIKLINVEISQDCKVEVISNTKDVNFSVLDSNSKVLAQSNKDDNFINYDVSSATFHLDAALDFSFYIKFSSSEQSELQIKRIVLSFSDNNSFLTSPGILKVKTPELNHPSKTMVEASGENSFKVTGTSSRVFSNKRILVSDNTLSNSVTVKNICDNPVHIYFGYSMYTKDGNKIINQNNPYKKINKVLKVVSSADKDSNKIVVDAYSDWKKGCTLALNAKEDLSDFPNSSFVNGTIQEVNQIDDDHVEIVFDKPIGKNIGKGTPCRIQESAGAANLYTHSLNLQPGQEIKLDSKMKKDDAFFQYSNKAFCKGCYYVVPLIYSYTMGEDTNGENTVLVTDFTVSY